MFGKMMGNGPSEDMDMKKKAIKELLMKLGGLEGLEDENESGEGEDYLDPEKLMQKGSDAGAEMGDESGSENPSEIEDEVNGEAESKFDPEEMMEFFSKRPGSERKPLKGMKVGMTEISMSPLKKGMSPMMKKRV